MSWNFLFRSENKSLKEKLKKKKNKTKLTVKHTHFNFTISLSSNTNPKCNQIIDLIKIYMHVLKIHLILIQSYMYIIWKKWEWLLESILNTMFQENFR